MVDTMGARPIQTVRGHNGGISGVAPVVGTGPAGPAGPTGPAGSVIGPASSVTGHIATYGDTTGDLIADSGVSIADLAPARLGGALNLVTDWNSAVGFGHFYSAPAATNAPAALAGEYVLGTFVGDTGTNGIQEVSGWVTSVPAATLTWQRKLVNSVWGAWYQLATTQAETDARAAAAVVTERTAAATLTNKTLTAPVINNPTGIAKADVGLGSVPNTDATNATNLASGTVPTARLGSGTANSGSYLRGDQTWASIGGGGVGDFVGPVSSTTDNVVLFADGTGKLGKDGGTVVSRVPAASTTVEGKIEIATNAEVVALSDTTRAVTPAGLNAALVNLAYQPGDADLTTIAGLAATTDNIIQSVAGAWASRTPTQVKTALALERVPNLETVSSRLTAAAALTSTTFTATGLSVTLAAGKAYRIRAFGQWRCTGSTAAGIGLRLNGTVTATGIRHSINIWGTATGPSTPLRVDAAALTTANSATTCAFATTDFAWEIEGLIRVNAGGTLIVEQRSSSGALTITTQPDSFLICEEVA